MVMFTIFHVVVGLFVSGYGPPSTMSWSFSLTSACPLFYSAGVFVDFPRGPPLKIVPEVVVGNELVLSRFSPCSSF